jgi:hypothetical protein
VAFIISALTGLAAILISFVESREWSVYPFVPPVFSLLVGWILVPIYNLWFDRRLAERLKNVPLFPGSPRRLAEKREQIRDIVLGSALQLSYLTALPTLIVTFLAVASEQEHSIVVFSSAVIAVLVVPAIWFLIYSPDPEYFNTTKLASEGWRNKWTYLKLYSVVLGLLNVLAISLIVWSLPSKKGP